jgi:hypothetical protein
MRSDKGAEAFREIREGQIFRECAAARGIEVAEDGEGIEERGRPRRLQGDAEVVEERGCKLAHVAIAFHHQGEHVTSRACKPVLCLLKLRL